MPGVRIPIPGMDARCAVYIMTNRHHTVLYVGVTSDLPKRVVEHRSGIHPSSFTRRYQAHRLVYVELTEHIEDAIRREKQLKGWSRAKKAALIERLNPDWLDLGDDIVACYEEAQGS